MPYYQYKAVDNDGSVVKGIINVTNIDAVYSATETSGLSIISVKRISPHLASLSNKLQARQVKRKDIIEFSNNLSVMIRAGIPILTALTDIIDTTENQYFMDKIENMKNNIALGSSFSSAVTMHSDIFPDIFIRLVSVGEETGNLDGSLQDVATHLQRVEDLASAIKRALVYPAFALLSATGALIFWLVYVLPRILTIFEDMNIAIPTITRLLIIMSDFTRDYWLVMLILPVALFFLIKALKRYEQPEYYIDLIKLRLPIYKHILVNKVLGLFSEQMRILIKAGLNIDRSFELASEIIGNRVYRDAIIAARDEVLSGATISAALKNQRVFSAMLVRMIHIGETSGTLDDQFSFLSEYFLKKLDDISQKLGKMLEPIIIIFLGLLFAIIIIGLLLPIYDLVSQLGRG